MIPRGMRSLEEIDKSYEEAATVLDGIKDGQLGKIKIKIQASKTIIKDVNDAKLSAVSVHLSQLINQARFLSSNSQESKIVIEAPEDFLAKLENGYLPPDDLKDVETRVVS